MSRCSLATSIGAATAQTALIAPGITVTERSAAIGAELSARIIEPPFKQGRSFEKGRRLVTFDCVRQGSELEAARADLGAAGVRHKANRKLDQYGAIGKSNVRISEAENAAARADAPGDALKSCAIDAPFSGRVSGVAVKHLETPQAEAPLFTSLDGRAN
ncbi:MAG: hypothetical protein AAF360_08205 [Pseudomonadota bacterium]